MSKYKKVAAASSLFLDRSLIITPPHQMSQLINIVKTQVFYIHIHRNI